MIRCELDTRNEKVGYKIREARQVTAVHADYQRRRKWRRIPSVRDRDTVDR